jgi:hypothetical protein
MIPKLVIRLHLEAGGIGDSAGKMASGCGKVGSVPSGALYRPADAHDIVEREMMLHHPKK